MRILWCPLILILGLAGCGSETDLGRGYSYVRLDGVNSVIADPEKEIVVLPTVYKYYSSENYIIGRRVDSYSPINSADSPPPYNYGYFIVDKNTNAVVEGLTLEQLIEMLRVNNLESIVEKILE